MTTVIKTKNSVTASTTPTTLVQGELAVNITDKKMWVGNAASTPVQITGSGSGTVAVADGGTGQTSYTDGQLLIGNSTGNTLTKATLTAGSNITITNGAGSITIASTGGGGGSTSIGLVRAIAVNCILP